MDVLKPLQPQNDVVLVAKFVATFVAHCIAFGRQNDVLESEMLANENLHLYGKALGFVAAATALSAAWDKRHAVADQFGRGSESLILNLAGGAKPRSRPNELRALAYAIGSCLECAACWDLAVQRRALCQARVWSWKEVSGKDRGDAVTDVRGWNKRGRTHEGRLTSTKEAMKVATKGCSASAENVQTPGAVGRSEWNRDLPGTCEMFDLKHSLALGQQVSDLSG